MKYIIYDNRLVNSVKRNTYKKIGSNILYVKIENFMIKLSYLKKCDIFKKSGGMARKYTYAQMEEMRRLYIIDDTIGIPELEKDLQNFVENDLNEIFEHCRKIEKYKEQVEILDDFLYSKYKITKNYGDSGEEELRKFLNIKLLLSSLLYIYKNYDPKDNIYIENLNYIHDLFTLLDEISMTGVYHYTEYVDILRDAYGINQRNIFTFVVWFVKMFKRKRIDLSIKKYFNVKLSNDKNGNFLEITDKVIISNSSVVLMINYLLRKMNNNKRKRSEIDKSRSSLSSSS